MRRAVPIVCLAALLAVAFPAHSQDVTPRPPAEIDADLLATIQNDTLESFIAKLLAPIRRAREPGRLTRQELTDRAVAERAAQRAQEVTEILRYDLDGDGVLVRAEAEQASVYSGRPGNEPGRRNWEQVRGEQLLERIFEADGNADDRIDLAEMLAWADKQADQPNRKSTLQELALELDANGDGATTVAEAETRARQLFARYDLDGDGVIDEDRRREVNRIESSRKSQAKLERNAERCGMPPASADARIVLFSTHRAQAVSSVAIDGPMEATLTAGVTVEPGTEKLYLVLAADRNMIWRIDGAVERLTNVVLLEGESDPLRSSAAVTGIDRSLVFWGPQETCALLRGTTAVQQTAARFTVLHGRPPDVFEQVDAITSVHVPSMEIVGVRREYAVPVKRTACRVALGRGGVVFSPDNVAGAEAAPCDWIRAEAELEFPGGVVELDPSSVLGRRPAVAYEVLPSPFGYRKALDDGVLTDLSEGFDIRFRVEKQLPYFPPAAGRGRQMVFELAEDIAMPRGKTQRICVLDSEGKTLPTDSYGPCSP